MSQKSKKIFRPFKALFGILTILLCFSWLNIRVGKLDRAGVQITSNRDSEVEINGSFVGKTPYYDDSLQPGTTHIKIRETTSGQNWEAKIDLKKGTVSVINQDFEDDNYKSNGYILSFNKSVEGSSSAVINSEPPYVSVFADGTPYGFTPSTIDLSPGPHTFRFTSTGYKEKEIKAELVSGYQLKINFSLAPVDSGNSTKESVVTIGENEVVVTPTYIEINPNLEMFDEKPLLLDQTNFPYLFTFNEEPTRINVKEFPGGDTPETKLIYISGQIPNHGTLVDNYYVIIDPEIGKVVEDGYNYLFGNVRLNNACTSCALPGLLFKEYSKKDRTFILANNKHKKEFAELLGQYEKFEKDATCRINKKDYSLSEALKVGKATDRCANQNAGANDPDAIDNYFIMLGEYKQIVNNLRAIIRGENVMMFPRGYHGEGLSPLIRWMVNSNGQTFNLPVDGKQNYFDQESIDEALGLMSIGTKI